MSGRTLYDMYLPAIKSTSSEPLRIPSVNYAYDYDALDYGALDVILFQSFRKEMR